MRPPRINIRRPVQRIHHGTTPIGWQATVEIAHETLGLARKSRTLRTRAQARAALGALEQACWAELDRRGFRYVHRDVRAVTAEQLEQLLEGLARGALPMEEMRR